MTNYECCYSSGRQFVFAERTSRRGRFFGVALLGMLGGLVVGVIVSLGGVFILGIFLLICGTSVAARGYYQLQRASSSVDFSGYVLGCCLGAAFAATISIAVWYTLFLGMAVMDRYMLFCAIGMVVGMTIYVFVIACCQEDERKHQISVCKKDDGLFRQMSPMSDADCLRANGVSLLDGWRELTRYFIFLYRWQWRLFVSSDSAEENVDECKPDDHIVVHNRTLKLIKVCFYSSDDVFCWVPYGGVAGRCVGFIQAEHRRAFSPLAVFPKSLQATDCFKLKIFQPGLFDKELACYPKAVLGQKFEFHDVEGMVKRSRSLSSDRSTLHARRPSESSEAESDGPAVRESSESELDISPVKEGPLLRSAASSCPPRSPTISPKESEGPLRRNCTATSLHAMGSPNGRRRSELRIAGSSCETRRAAPNEVVVRNRSNQEIRVLLFRSTDYACWVPLVGHLLACGDVILPDQERRFIPACNEKEFTVKVYSVGPGAKELTYLTVKRGQVYTVSDSLLF